MARAFRVAVLASGSKGNVTLVRAAGHTLLIDLGISCTRVVQKLREQGVEPEQVEAVLFTHEHIDHVRGMETFRKRYPNIPLWASAGTWRGLFGSRWQQLAGLRPMPAQMALGALTVRRFATSHDALEPVGYTLEFGGHKLAYMTDTGFVTEDAVAAMQGVETLVLEANHDLELLKHGSYPEPLKKRIMGSQGHLCNLAAGWLLKELPQLPQDIFLAHLSQENNRPEVARETILQLLGDRDMTGVNLWVTDQERTTTNDKEDEPDGGEDIFA